MAVTHQGGDMRMSTSVQATVEGEIPSFASIRVTQAAEAVSVIKGMPNGRNGTFQMLVQWR